MREGKFFIFINKDCIKECIRATQPIIQREIKYKESQTNLTEHRQSDLKTKLWYYHKWLSKM